jgi:hypothetical protein
VRHALLRRSRQNTMGDPMASWFSPVHAEWEQLVAKAREFRALPKL